MLQSGLSRFLRDVYTGLDAGQFLVLHQPVVDLGAQSLEGFEALVRWSHPRYGLLAPDGFVPLLERTGHLAALTRHVLVRACTAAASWPDCDGAAPRVRVNLPAALLGDAGTHAEVLATLAATGLAPERLVLEVTETGVLGDVAAAQAGCARLRAGGVRVALDDYGTGECDVVRLLLLDVDEVKVDRSLMVGVPRDRDRLAAVQEMVDLGRTMDLAVTVEGVETVEQLAVLQPAVPVLAQGFLFGRPRVLDGPEHVRVLSRRCRRLLRGQPGVPTGVAVRGQITRSG